MKFASIQQAITRLGLKMVRSLVVSLAMRQIFQATSDTLDRQFRQLRDDSLQVAAISHMLAAGIPQLER
jgi:HD-like signal output (HDOD) protein